MLYIAEYTDFCSKKLIFVFVEKAGKRIVFGWVRPHKRNAIYLYLYFSLFVCVCIEEQLVNPKSLQRIKMLQTQYLYI